MGKFDFWAAGCAGVEENRSETFWCHRSFSRTATATAATRRARLPGLENPDKFSGKSHFFLGKAQGKLQSHLGAPRAGSSEIPDGIGSCRRKSCTPGFACGDFLGSAASPDAPFGFGVIPRYPTRIWGPGHHIHQDVASALFLPKPLLLQFSVLKTTTGVIQPPPECLLPGKNGLDSNLSSSPPQITPDKLPFVGAAAPSHLSPLRGSSLPIYFPLTVPGIFRTPCNYGHGLVYPCQRRLSA